MLTHGEANGQEDARHLLEQEMFDFEVMREDFNKYNPRRKKFFRDKQEQIIRCHAARNVFNPSNDPNNDQSNVYFPSPSPSEPNPYEYLY